MSKLSILAIIPALLLFSGVAAALDKPFLMEIYYYADQVSYPDDKIRVSEASKCLTRLNYYKKYEHVKRFVCSGPGVNKSWYRNDDGTIVKVKPVTHTIDESTDESQESRLSSVGKCLFGRVDEE